MEPGIHKDNDNASVSSAAVAGKKPPFKKLILGKDGKPCKTCNSYRDFASAATATATAAAVPNKLSTKATDGITALTVPADCPPDAEELGRASWTLLHSIAAQYPTQATTAQQSEMQTFIHVFSRLYPCWVCADDFRTWIKRSPIESHLTGRLAFGDWLCRAHNDVNRKLGKKEFDCALWEQRWRDGWRDGRCD